MNIDGPERWLPIDFTFTPVATSVRWMDFGCEELTEPFFHRTVKKLRLGNPPARERVGDLATFLAMASQRPPVKPSGVIFHISRCGSTLVGNALRTGNNVTVVSEAKPFGKIFDPNVFGNSCFTVEEWDVTRKLFLDSLTRLFAFQTHRSGARVVIKCHAASIRWISLIRSVWPEVPFLVLIRDPVEVMVSNLALPASWMKRRVQVSLSEESANTSEVERCARGVGFFCESATKQLDKKCKVVDYARLDTQTLCEIGNFFHIPLRTDSSHFRQVLERDAKDPAGTKPFQDDRERKLRQANDLVKSSAERWAREAYEKLKGLQAP